MPSFLNVLCRGFFRQKQVGRISRRRMDEQKNEHRDQHDDGNRRDDPAEQVSRHRLSSSSFSREETSIPSLPALLLDDDLGAEDAAPRVGLILNALGFAI